MVDISQIQSLHKNLNYFLKKYIFLILACFIVLTAFSIYKNKNDDKIFVGEQSFYTNAIEPIILNEYIGVLSKNALTRNYASLSTTLNIPIERAKEINSIVYVFNADKYRSEFLPFGKITIESSNVQYLDTLFNKIEDQLNDMPFVNDFYSYEFEHNNQLIKNLDLDIQKIKQDLEDSNSKGIIDLGNLHNTLFLLQKNKAELVKVNASVQKKITPATKLITYESKTSLTLSLIISFIAATALAGMLILLIEFISIGRRSRN